MSEEQQGDPADDAIRATAADASLGAVEWPAGEAEEPHGRAEVEASMEGSKAAQAAEAAGAPSEQRSRTAADRESDDGELTPSDPSRPMQEHAGRAGEQADDVDRS